MVLDYLALENRIIRLETKYENLIEWMDTYEDDIDLVIAEIEGRLIKLEKGDSYGNR